MTYESEVLADSPLAWWRQGEASGTVMADSSGNGRDATFLNTGNLTYAQTSLLPQVPSDTAIKYNSTGRATLAFASWMYSTSFTVEAWVNVTTTSGTQNLLARRTGGGSSGDAWQFRIDGGKPQVLSWHGGLRNLMAASALSLGVHHLVATITPTQIVIYDNGAVLTSSTFGSANPTSNSTELWFSSWGNGNEPLNNATLDEVAFYGTALSGARVLAHYNAGMFPPAGLQARGDAQSDASVQATVIISAVPGSPRGDAQSDASVTPAIINMGETHNRTGGRWRNGIGTATWSPTVIIPPAPEIGGARLSALAFNTPTVDEATGRISYNATRVEQDRHVDRVVVGNKDITVWRGVVTPIPGYGLVEPLGYGPATLVLPQVHAAFEVVGEGALRFLRPGAAVQVERVDRETGEVVAVDYKGIIVSFDVSGDALTCQVGGEASGRAALRERQVPIFYWYKDLGRYFHDAIRGLGLPFSPYLGPEVGIRVQRFGGTGYLDFIQQLVAMGWTRDGNRWTVMPNEATGKYEAFRKDTTAIHATAYLDDQRTVGSLVRDMSEEPNRIFLTGVQPDGLRVRFGGYPGLKFTNPPPYPFDDNSTFGQGTTDADTDTGDGITILINRLYITKYLDREDLPGGYDAGVTRAIKDLQRDGGIAVTGNVNVKTWRVLYDLDSTGFSLRGARILPAAQKSEVKPWNLSPSGAKISRNPGFNRRVLPVDRNVDIGTGFEKDQMREWARAELEQAVTSNWTGTLVFNTGALIAGQHDPGDPLTTADLMPAKALRAGMNIWLPLFDGGTLVHVSGIDVSPEGTVTASVDTRARDALEVWEVIARNRESRKSLRRAWIQEHRASTNRKDSIAPWDEVGGVLGDKVSVPGNRWTVFPVIAGQEGIIQRLRVDTNPNAEFVMAVFGRRIAAGRLRRMVGNPLTRVGSKKWEREDLRDRLDASNILLYVAGSDSEPLGYWPKKKSGRDDNDSGAAPLTGRWQDDATFPYRCFPASVLWVAIWADRDTTIPRGRIMWPQLEAGA